MSADELPIFVVTAPGLERVAADELRAIGAPRARVIRGGVEVRGTPQLLLDANLRLRTASRVLVRVAEFHANSFHELERRAARVPWELWVAAGIPVRFRVTAHKSKLYHSDAVAERLLRAVATRLKTDLPAVAAERDEEREGADAQLFVVRLLDDQLTISADSSGALLHLRGYRQATAKAPLRETIAAAMLLASGWDAVQPLVDPMCGSGTIPIEAALMARRIAPGLATGTPRRYAFERWPGHDDALWSRTVDRARSESLASSPTPILASDRDAGAISATESNADRAGVGADIRIERAPATAITPPDGSGWLVSNPPYGHRVGGKLPLRDLYAAFGRMASERLRGWTIALLTADVRLERQLGLPLQVAFTTRNGGIPVRMVVARP